MEQERSVAVSMAGPAFNLHGKLFYEGSYMIFRMGLKMSPESPVFLVRNLSATQTYPIRLRG